MFSDCLFCIYGLLTTNLFIVLESLQDSVPVETNCTNYEVRLEPENSPFHSRGKVQMCFNGIWGVMCSGGFRGRSSEVVCNQLGNQRRGIMYYSSLYCMHGI